jgi:hypothetical protein
MFSDEEIAFKKINKKSRFERSGFFFDPDDWR